MNAAIYARKSTEQLGVAEEERSVTRQIDHATAYAARKGWAVAPEHVYVDDGISGAEFAARPEFLRLMNSVKPKPAFGVLVMSEESRLGRESIEVSYALKQIVQAGVRVFFYLEDRERTLDSPTDKIMLSLATFADELEREKARQRTYDAMSRKAKAGHVTGGRLFGYDNVPVVTPGGTRSHVERRINEPEAVVIRRIFELAAAGWGKRRIAIALNDDGAPSPRAQQGRPGGWAPSSVFEVLNRSSYRGEITWNASRKRDRWGQHHQVARPSAEWVHVPAPHLRIVSDELWQAAQTRLDAARGKYLKGTDGRAFGRPPGHFVSKYLLTGLAACGACGGGLLLNSRAHGSHRAFRYGCSSHYKRGSGICENHLELPMEQADALVVDGVREDILTSRRVELALDYALELLEQDDPNERTQGRLEARLRVVTRQIENLTTAVEAGGQLRGLLERLRTAEETRADLEAQLVRLGPTRRPTVPARGVLRRKLEAKLGAWRDLLGRNVPETRALLGELFPGRIAFNPDLQRGTYEIVGVCETGRIFRELVPLTVASPRGTEPVARRTAPGIAFCISSTIRLAAYDLENETTRPGCIASEPS